MTSFDASILFSCLAAIGMVFLMPRSAIFSAIFGLLIFVWVGGSIGLCIAYSLYYDADRDRMKLDKSFPLMFVGMLIGSIPGYLISFAHASYERVRPWIEVLSVTLLFGAAAAVLDCVGRTEGISLSRILQSAAIGVTIGFCLGFVQWQLNRSKRRVEIIEASPTERS